MIKLFCDDDDDEYDDDDDDDDDDDYDDDSDSSASLKFKSKGFGKSLFGKSKKVRWSRLLCRKCSVSSQLLITFFDMISVVV